MLSTYKILYVLYSGNFSMIALNSSTCVVDMIPLWMPQVGVRRYADNTGLRRLITKLEPQT
jgi:hypothetical protein